MPNNLKLDNTPFPILGFAAESGSGKTTLLKKIIPLLKANALSIGLIKHSHHKVIFDNHPYSQSLLKYTDLSIAGSNDYFSAKTQINEKKALLDAISDYRSFPIDLLLIEGYKHFGFNKIEIHRHELNNPLLCLNDPNIIAVATNNKTELEKKGLNLPILDLNNSQSITSWIIRNQLKN